MSSAPQHPLTTQEINTVSNLLGRLNPGFLPFEIFHAIARITTTPVIQVVPLRLVNGDVEVLLTKRDADDPHWPGMLHVAGTVLRATDSEGDYRTAFERILNDELAAITTIGKPHYVKSFLQQETRGMVNATVFFVEVSGTPSIGIFYGVENLPMTIIETQIEFIRAAAQKFRTIKQ